MTKALNTFPSVADAKNMLPVLKAALPINKSDLHLCPWRGLRLLRMSQLRFFLLSLIGNISLMQMESLFSTEKVRDRCATNIDRALFLSEASVSIEEHDLAALTEKYHDDILA